MDTPDQAIPHDLLQSAKCIAIIPGDIKSGLIFGGSYGRGVASCRTVHGWSAPMFVAVEGGSVRYQIGGSSTDLVMLFMNDHALHRCVIVTIFQYPRCSMIEIEGTQTAESASST